MKSTIFKILLLPFLLISCVGEDVTNIDVAPEINLLGNDALFSIAEDETNLDLLQLNPTFSGFNSNDFSLVYKSNNENILTINSNGILTPIMRGMATITISLINNNFLELENPTPEIEETVNILVGLVTITLQESKKIDDPSSIAENGFPPMLSFTNNIVSIDLNDTDSNFKLSTEFKNFKNEIDNSVNVSFVSSDSDVLTVSADGTLNAIALGSATITALVVVSGKEIKATQNIEVGGENVVIIPDPEPEPQASILGSGSLQTFPGYSTTGDFEITLDNGIQTFLLKDNFESFAPRTAIILSNSKNSMSSNSFFIANGVSPTGAQSFTIPNNIDVSSFKYIFVYCSAFGVPLGYGEIQR